MLKMSGPIPRHRGCSETIHIGSAPLTWWHRWRLPSSLPHIVFPHLLWKSLRTTIARPMLRRCGPFLCPRRTREVTTPCKSTRHSVHGGAPQHTRIHWWMSTWSFGKLPKMASVVVRVEVGLNFGRIWPICATCAAMGWHASIPARCFSAVLARAGRGLAAIPAATARRLPGIIFFAIFTLDDIFPISWCGSGCPGLSCRQVGQGCSDVCLVDRSAVG